MSQAKKVAYLWFKRYVQICVGYISKQMVDLQYPLHFFFGQTLIEMLSNSFWDILLTIKNRNANKCQNHKLLCRADGNNSFSYTLKWSSSIGAKQKTLNGCIWFYNQCCTAVITGLAVSWNLNGCKQCKQLCLLQTDWSSSSGSERCPQNTLQWPSFLSVPPATVWFGFYFIATKHSKGCFCLRKSALQMLFIIDMVWYWGQLCCKARPRRLF